MKSSNLKILGLQFSGVWERPTFKEICWLFKGELFVNVRTSAFKKGEIRGKVKQLPYGGHHVSYQGMKHSVVSLFLELRKLDVSPGSELQSAKSKQARNPVSDTFIRNNGIYLSSI